VSSFAERPRDGRIIAAKLSRLLTKNENRDPPVMMSKDGIDPYLAPPFSLGSRLLRLTWGIVYVCLFRPSPRPFHALRRVLLRLFGAQLGPNAKIYPTARIWAPWKFVCDEASAIAEEAIIYNPETLHMGSHAVVSQQAYICGATHDYEDPAFPLRAYPIRLGAYSWVCARATAQPGVNLGDGAVLALGSVATKDLAPSMVYGGVPARRIKARTVIQPK
jgi:putative colanic acid biosynthesis acetyltransferase WcaF